MAKAKSIESVGSKRTIIPPTSAREGMDSETSTFWVILEDVNRKHRELKRTLMGKPLDSQELDDLIKQTESYMAQAVEAYSKAGSKINMRTALDRAESDAKKLIDAAEAQVSTLDKQEGGTIKNRGHSAHNSVRGASIHSHAPPSVQSSLSYNSAKLREQQAYILEQKIRMEADKKRAVLEDELLKKEAQRKAEEILKDQEEAANWRKRKREIDSAEQARLLDVQEEMMSIKSEMGPTKNSGFFCDLMESKPQLASPSVNIQERRSANLLPDNATNNALTQSLVAALSLSRMAAPEPYVFNGDPLKYTDWSATFDGLVGSKPIPDGDKLHYLKQYLGGPAREAVCGLFLLDSDAAYHEARKVLRERYGMPHAICDAFRGRLEAWPKIASGDASSLRKFADFLNQCRMASQVIKGMGILGDEHENKKMLAKLPIWLAVKWAAIVAKGRKKGEFPSFNKFTEFITEQADTACDPILVGNKTGTNDYPPKNVPQRKSTKANTLATIETPSSEEHTQVSQTSSICLFCKKDNHRTAECYILASKPIKERKAFIEEERLCFACLRKGHLSKDCKYKRSCRKCNKTHPTALHEERTKVQATQSQNNAETVASVGAVSTRTKIKQQPALCSMVVPVWVSSPSAPDEEVLVYALLDTQSNLSFISNDVAEKIDGGIDATLKMSTMTSKNERILCKKYEDLMVRGLDSKQKITIPLSYSRDIIPVGKEHIPTPTAAKQWSHLQHVADSIHDLQDCEVGVLIGYNCAQALTPREVVSGKGNEPFAVRTDLGWSMVGAADREGSEEACHNYNLKIEAREVIHPAGGNPQKIKYCFKTQAAEERCSFQPERLLDALEQDFRAEEGSCEPQSVEDKKFIKIVNDGFHQDSEGFCTIPLPFKNKPGTNNSLDVAHKRMALLERKFSKNPEFKKEYEQFVTEIIAKREAEEVPKGELGNTNSWYIPHFGVYHPKKPNKIRVVFDGSARAGSTCLNDYLLQGPDLMNCLVGVLMRFRKEKVAIMGDIERMFHQFRVANEDRDWLRFLWYNDEGKLVPFRMKVHLFGATSSPGCATFGLRKLADVHSTNQEGSQIAKEFIQRDFYVDDGITSVPSTAAAVTLIKNVTQICAQGNVRIHKFISNDKGVLAAVPESERAKELQSLDLSTEALPTTRTLGIGWCTNSDTFQFHINLKEQPATRRGILSTIASVYDPLGFVAPYLLQGKSILQELCKRKATWDEPIQEETLIKWNNWKETLPELGKLQIDRCYHRGDFASINLKREIHHFSDASMSGYGQCSYLRTAYPDGSVTCSLVMGKARVTPLKITTIPRLELQAAVISTKISKLLQEEMRLADAAIKEFFWTDSKVVLGYISNEARRFHIYVANRVQTIRDHTDPKQWHYVPSKENPADHASRGLSPSQLLESNWLKGPEFLYNENIQYPDPTKDYQPESGDPEVKVHSFATTGAENKPILSKFQKFSTWASVVRAVKVLQKHIRTKIKRVHSELTAVETDTNAELQLIKMLQEDAFSNEIYKLEKRLSLGEGSSLIKLDPFLDKNNIMRVGGRLQKGPLHQTEIHPIILPGKTHLTKLFVQHQHALTAHQGTGITTQRVRKAGFWVTGLNKAVSRCIHNCVICKKLRGKPQLQQMAPLPKERSTEAPPFTYSGCDCFGPFTTQDGRKIQKRYVVLFTCLASRAVHLELIEDMSADAFINALRCLIAIRGPVRLMQSDCGTNFVGGANELLKAENENDDKIKDFLASVKCEFKTNPPSASHMGGVWERQIRTARSVLAGILETNKCRLSTATLRTLLYEVMSIINSRPLTTEGLHSDPTLIPICPNDLLTMKTNVALPPPGKFSNADLYSRKRWRQVQQLANTFWERWRKTYLASLQARQKWFNKKPSVKIGDVVILKEDNPIRGTWRLGIVDSVKVSSDGLTRSVRLRMSTAKLTKKGKRLGEPVYLDRPIHKLVVICEAGVV